MPYYKEIASGESLVWLENSQALKDFKGVMLQHENIINIRPETLNINRYDWCPRRVIAIDGSNIIHRVNNGFPGAELGLLMISVIVIKLESLQDISPDKIPSPSFFRNMEDAHTVQVAVPGIGVVHKNVKNDSPIKYFRRVIKESFNSAIAKNHETLLETLKSVTSSLDPRIICPGEGCSAPFRRGVDICNTCGEELYETDVLRLHEYFDDVRSSGDAHGRLRSVLEIITLLNILRFFEKNRPEYLADCAFVLDGPLAVFGTPASILRPIRKELLRLNETAKQKNGGKDIVLFGVEKTGMFCEHWEQIDWDDQAGYRTRYAPKSIIAPDSKYIRQNIAPGKTDKPHGKDTHFGRYVLYKTNKGEHVVINTAMLNDKSQNFDNTDEDCYPRLGDILAIMDQLATYLYRDGFLPLVRAHANAAIPLKRGTDIIKSIIDNE